MGYPDKVAIEKFYDSNLIQHSFSDWNYAQKIEAIKYSEKMIRKNFQQCRRADLENKPEEESAASVQCRQKSSDHCGKSTIRDKMGRRLGITTATLSKYRSIIKLPENLIDAIARLLDQKKISFEAAYRMSGLILCEARMLVDYIDKSEGKKIGMDKLKEIREKSWFLYCQGRSSKKLWY